MPKIGRPVCSTDTETGRAELAEAELCASSKPIDAGTVQRDFGEALLMLARLPLTDAERAEAVRRLMGDAGGKA